MDPAAAIATFASVGFILMVVLVFVVVLARQSRGVTEGAVQLARDAGWADIRTSQFLGMRVRGIWNGYPAELRRRPRQKGAPERMVLKITVQAPARIAITRRKHGLFSRPFAIAGPPLVEYPPAAQFWLRADEISLIERLFATSIPAMLDRNLTGRYDFLRLGGDALTIQRASDWNREKAVAVAREELALAKAVIDALALRP